MSIRLAMAMVLALAATARAQDDDKKADKKADAPKADAPKPQALQSADPGKPQGTPQAQAAPQAQPQPAKAEPKKAVTVKALVKPECPLSKRIFLVLDVSGSMKADGKIDRVLEIASEIAGQPIDEAEFAIITFNGGYSRWEGCPEPDANKPVPKGWARLPSDENLKKARAWLSQFPGEGDTQPSAPFLAALEDPREDLCIVFVSDGEFERAPTIRAIESGQKWREEKGLGKAVIMAYGIGIARKNDEDTLAKIATMGKGGFYVDDKPKDDEDHPRLVSPVGPRIHAQPPGFKKLEDLKKLDDLKKPADPKLDDLKKPSSDPPKSAPPPTPAPAPKTEPEADSVPDEESPFWEFPH